MKLGVNGAIVDAEQAVISVYDHGFLYGMGLFETLRTYAGVPFALNRHLARLRGGCEELGISWPWQPEQAESVLAAHITEVLAANGLRDAYVRLTISAGEAELGLPTADYTSPKTIVMVKPLPAASEELYEKGKALRLLRTRRNTPETNVRLKSLHYMNNVAAKRELNGLSDLPPGTEGLMVTQDEWLAEGVVSNLFFAVAGADGKLKVCTPRTGLGILPGITRAITLELAADAGYDTEAGNYTWEDLLRADEVWVTNSVQELVPISTLIDVDGQSYIVGSGSAGGATRRLLADYRRLAGCPIEKGG